MNRFQLLNKLGFKRIDSGHYVRDCIEVNTKTNRIKYGLMNLLWLVFPVNRSPN